MCTKNKIYGRIKSKGGNKKNRLIFFNYISIIYLKKLMKGGIQSRR